MHRFSTALISIARAACAAAALASPTAVALADAEEQRPNIVLLMGDDHGWDETSYNGHPHVRTPVLDQMAAQGLRLDRFYAAHPSCSPTRGSILTGRHPNRYGVFNPGWSLRPEEISIAQLLHDAGYACGHFGKWHLGPVKAESPTNPGAMGFDEWLSHDNFFELDPVLSRNGAAPKKFPGESSEVIVREALRFIADARSAGKPFFVVVWYGSPHEPYSGLDEDLSLYDDVPAKYADRTVSVTSNDTGERIQRPLGEVLRERYAEITAMDRSIGQLRDTLAQLDVKDNTLLWYCGDNGSPQGGSTTSPFRDEKGAVYEGGIRVPGVIEWPARIGAPRVSDVNTVTTDTLPTLCDLVDLPRPSRPIDGVGLVPLLDGKMVERSTPICFWTFPTGDGALSGLKPYLDPRLQEGTTPLVKKLGGRFTRNFQNVRVPQALPHHYNGPRTILDNRYKLVVDAGPAARELFDVREDPAERVNLVDQRADIAASLQQQLDDWQQSVVQSLTGADYR